MLEKLIVHSENEITRLKDLLKEANHESDMLDLWTCLEIETVKLAMLIKFRNFFSKRSKK